MRPTECAVLRSDEDYLVDSAAKRVTLTDHCLQKIYRDYTGRLRLDLERPWAKYVEQAVTAKVLHKRDIDYVVRDGKVLPVAEFTGRIFPDRTWCNGLHQAVETKEGLLPIEELSSAARVSRQPLLSALQGDLWHDGNRRWERAGVPGGRPASR